MEDTMKNLSPEELAEVFWNMHSDQHVEFFNALGLLVGNMWKLYDQIEYVRGDIRLSEQAIDAMDAFGGK